MSKTATTFAIALGVLAQYPLVAGGVRSVTLRRECTMSRCVYYRGATRAFSIEQEHGTGRYVVRDRRGTLRAKVKEQGSGTLKVEGDDQGW